jgi:hypothetical protein
VKEMRNTDISGLARKGVSKRGGRVGFEVKWEGWVEKRAYIMRKTMPTILNIPQISVLAGKLTLGLCPVNELRRKVDGNCAT